MNLVRLMQAKVAALVDAYVAQLMKALEPELRARFMHLDAKLPKRSPITLAGETLKSLGQIDDVFRPDTLAGLRASEEFRKTGRTSKAFDRQEHETGIKVAVEKDGTLILRSGSHRFHVARELGLETIHGTVVDAATGRVLFVGDIPLKRAAQEGAAPIAAKAFEVAAPVAPGAGFLRSVFHLVDHQAALDLNRVIGVPSTAVLPNARILEQKWLHGNTELIKLEERSRREVEAIITDPLRQGARVEEIRGAIQERLGIARSRAETNARSQTLRLYGQIQQERQQAAGIEEYVWSTSEDERVRPDHADLDGTTQRWDTPPIVDKRTGRREHPGFDYQCLPGNSQVLLANPVNRLWRNRYRGQLTLLVTDTGETLECTPNHPILTAAGWLPAERVQVGDDVFQAGACGRQLAEAYVEDREPCIAEVFKAYRLAFGLRGPHGVAAEFEHDGVVDQHVDVVDMDRRLRPDDESAFCERLRELDFADADPPAFALRDAELVLQTQGLPASCGIRALRLRLAQHFVRIREAGEVGRTASADHDAVALEQIANCQALYAEPLGQLFDRRAVTVETQALILREWLGVVRRSIAATVGEPRAQALAIDAESLTDAGPRAAIGAKPVRVVQKRVRQFDGHTYNFSTQGAWYIAQNLIVHNCRCAAIPVLND